MPAMKKLADSAEVISVGNTSDSEFCHTYATINFKISDTLVGTHSCCNVDMAGYDYL